MALIKEKMAQFGIPASYWRVGMISIDRHRKEASYSLNLFFDRDAEEFLETKAVSLLGIKDKTQYDEYFAGSEFDNIVQACYEHAKAKVNYFKTAIDG